MAFSENGVSPDHEEPPSRAALPIVATLALTFKIFVRSPGTFVGLLLLEFLLAAVVSAIVAFTKGETWYPAAHIVEQIVTTAIQLIVNGAIVFGACEIMKRGAFEFDTALGVGVGVRRVGAILAIGLLQMLATVIGILLLIVPGIIVGLMLSVAVPVCVIDALGPIQSLKRSMALTKGSRWRILGLFMTVFAVALVGVLFVAGLVLQHLLVAAIPLGIAVFLVFLIVVLILPAALYLQLRSIDAGREPLVSPPRRS